jgi:hypothetical protein
MAEVCVIRTTATTLAKVCGGTKKAAVEDLRKIDRGIIVAYVELLRHSGTTRRNCGLETRHRWPFRERAERGNHGG